MSQPPCFACVCKQEGQTLLHVACLNKGLDIVTLLLDRDVPLWSLDDVCVCSHECLSSV